MSDLAALLESAAVGPTITRCALEVAELLEDLLMASDDDIRDHILGKAKPFAAKRFSKWLAEQRAKTLVPVKPEPASSVVSASSPSPPPFFAHDTHSPHSAASSAAPTTTRVPGPPQQQRTTRTTVAPPPPPRKKTLLDDLLEEFIATAEQERHRETRLSFKDSAPRVAYEKAAVLDLCTKARKVGLAFAGTTDADASSARALMDRVLESAVPDATFFLAGSILLRVPRAELAVRAVIPLCLDAFRKRPPTTQREAEAEYMADTLDTFANAIDTNLGPAITAWKLQLNSIVAPPSSTAAPNETKTASKDRRQPQPQQQQQQRSTTRGRGRGRQNNNNRGGGNARRTTRSRSRSRDSSNSGSDSSEDSNGRGNEKKGDDDDDSDVDSDADSRSSDSSDEASSSRRRPSNRPVARAVPRVVVSASHAANAAKRTSSNQRKSSGEFSGTVALVCEGSRPRSYDCFILHDDPHEFPQPSILCSGDSCISPDSVGARVDFDVVRRGKADDDFKASIVDINPEQRHHKHKSRAIPRDEKRYVGRMFNVDCDRKFGFLRRDPDLCASARRAFPKKDDGQHYSKVFFHFSAVSHVGLRAVANTPVEFTFDKSEEAARGVAAVFLAHPPVHHRSSSSSSSQRR